jgi:hypothetical protein
MKLASYIADGKECYGVVTGDGVITMNDRFGGHAASLREAIAGGLLPRIKEAASQSQVDRKLSDIKFLPVIPNPEKILCVGITTSPTPPSTAPRRRSCRTSSPSSSTRWRRMKASCCGRRSRRASTSRASSRW